jgi:hypothetical protein
MSQPTAFKNLIIQWVRLNVSYFNTCTNPKNRSLIIYLYTYLMHIDIWFNIETFRAFKLYTFINFFNNSLCNKVIKLEDISKIFCTMFDVYFTFLGKDFSSLPKFSFSRHSKSNNSPKLHWLMFVCLMVSRSYLFKEVLTLYLIWNVQPWERADI